jgi:hypothetical protein
MSMEDFMKALVQTGVQAAQSQQGQDALSGVLGGLLGGQQQGGSQQGGQNALSGVLGGLLGGAQQGGTGQGDQMLGALEQIIGGKPGSGNFVQGAAATMGANDPVMLLLQPLVSQLAVKAKIDPSIATVVVSLVVHYLLSSHPSTSPKNPLDLSSVVSQLASGGVSKDVLNNSGMVNDVMGATGLNKTQAVKSLDTTFNLLGSYINQK